MVLEKKFLSWWIMHFFGKTMNNVRRHRDIKLATTETRYYLVSEPNYHTTKKFSWKVVNYRNKENINIHD